MKDLLLVARRGVDCMIDPRVAKALLASGLLWTVLNKLFGWLLLGPALVVLFRISLKALRGEEPDVRRDNVAVLQDLPAALVAGILFALPFKLWDLLAQLGDGVRQAQAMVDAAIPVTASAAVLVHFAFHIFIFPVLAERHCGLVEASTASRELADQPGRGGSRLHGLGRHLIFTCSILVVILLASAWYWRPEVSWIATTLVGPPAIVLLSSWYLHVTGSPTRDVEVPAAPETEAPE